ITAVIKVFKLHDQIVRMSRVPAVRKRWSFAKEIFMLFYAMKDRRTPWYAQLTAFTSLIYLFSPADFLPDIIPFAGYIDDLIIVPFLLNISARLLPSDVRRAAEARAVRNNRKLRWVGVVVLLVAI